MFSTQNLHPNLVIPHTHTQTPPPNQNHLLTKMERWYNTTYALYSAMILLYPILASSPGIPEDELLDVEKSLEIFESMKDIIVARRCAEIIREVLDVTRLYLGRRRLAHAQHAQLQMQTSPSLTLGRETGAGADTSNLHYANNTYSNPNNNTHTLQPNLLPTITSTPPANPDENYFSLFGQEELQPDTRAEILANLVDPMILGDFAFGGGGVWRE